MSRIYKRFDGLDIFLITVVILAILAYSALILWWFIWSILDLVHGNPATWWNILGIIWGGGNLLGRIFSRSKK